QKAGFGLRVYNRTPEKARPLVEGGAAQADTPAGAAEAGGIVVTMLTNDQAVEEVAFGENGFEDVLGAGGVHVSMSTISPELTRRLAERHGARGTHYVAAPVFGKPDAAAA